MEAEIRVEIKKRVDAMPREEQERRLAELERKYERREISGGKAPPEFDGQRYVDENQERRYLRQKLYGA